MTNPSKLSRRNIKCIENACVMKMPVAVMTLFITMITITFWSKNTSVIHAFESSSFTPSLLSSTCTGFWNKNVKKCSLCVLNLSSPSHPHHSSGRNNNEENKNSEHDEAIQNEEHLKKKRQNSNFSYMENRLPDDDCRPRRIMGENRGSDNEIHKFPGKRQDLHSSSSSSSLRSPKFFHKKDLGGKNFWFSPSPSSSPKTSIGYNLDEWGVEIQNHHDDNDHDKPSSSTSSSSSSRYVQSSTHTTTKNPNNPVPPNTPICPNSLNEVAEAAQIAISSTLYYKNFLDPNIAVNAMAKSYINDVRPVGFAFSPEGRDVGRLGIEIDGARFLTGHNYNNMEGENLNLSNSSSSSSYVRQLMESEGRSLRQLSLILAAKLSHYPWNGLEEEYDDDDHDHHDMNIEKNIHHSTTKRKTRPVVLYFNTLRQALLASSELKLLKMKQKLCHLHKNKNHHNHHNNNKLSDKNNKEEPPLNFDNIRILCLGQDGIPSDMTPSTQKPNYSKTTGKLRKKWGFARQLANGEVDPKQGLILLIQPTDYNAELSPPSPAIHTLPSLQRLLAQASVEQIPAVMISPRLTEQYAQFDDRSTTLGVGGTSAGGGYEQSGYQKSSTYGGIEPPRGPTPWILRDFIPPVFSWVGNALEITKRRPSPSSVLMHHEDANNDWIHEDGHGKYTEIVYNYYSRIVMMQSVMEPGHAWNLFAVKGELKNIRGMDATRDSSYHISSKNRSRHQLKDLQKKEQKQPQPQPYHKCYYQFMARTDP
eukprot:CAMPEP_0184859408 /NCGR_PEP_ID=MMETSP0580-20130426/4403_1 /TAXON_ID=1118495 /ORGANISM="Dactyliosolen fragilissimus" /LENGTH=758 /DNA_ID=CAMNT_0027356017 /DNA_START=133 /DNA_END=2406 /DNA_ORIENTATION=-